YKRMGYATAAEFVKAMSRSEREQIRALILFFKRIDPSLIGAMKSKNFRQLAEGFNGPAYRENLYDEKLLNSYKKWNKK
ncbi:MAG TPA: N-acetylmuramidase domain-containing protein, partial [Noviherbaspirillum sp.]|nr:N-acetylmuramidase domain-containing protein [Noviherbaspirillum sp.]